MFPYEHSEVQRIDVPGGWIYHGGPLGHPILVSDPACWALPEDNARVILAAIADLHTEIKRMSQTLSQQIDTATASLQADLGTLTTGVTNLESELATALAGVVPGSTVTQAQVDALTAVHTSLAALSTSIPAPAPTPTPAA